MAKDPAFLFYSDNFQSGTQFLTDEQTGKYIRLMCAQHLHGHLTEKQMLIICKSYDKDIFDKFKKDDAGNYYNERLELEITKRKNYSLSRSLNKKGHLKIKKKRKSYDNHMGNENEDVNGIVNELVFIEYCKEILKEKFAPLEFSLKAKYESWVSNGWKDGHDNIIKNWKSKIKNTIPYLKPEYNKPVTHNKNNTIATREQLLNEKL